MFVFNRAVRVLTKKIKTFSCVLHTANTLTYFENFYFKKRTNIQSLKENMF